jgi:hypothetical protein
MLDPLLIRPTPIPLECLDSYLERIGERNVYSTFYWYNELLKNPKFSKANFYHQESIFIKLSELTLISREKLLSMTLHPYLPIFFDCSDLKNFQVTSWKDLEFPIWTNQSTNMFLQRNSNLRKICPYCYDENRAYLIPWQFFPVTSCPIHNILLVDYCMQCGKKLMIEDGECKACGKLVKNCKNKNDFLSTYDKDLSIILWNYFLPEKEKIKKALLISNPLLEGLIKTPASFVNYLWKMGNFLHIMDKLNPSIHSIPFEKKYYRISVSSNKERHILNLEAYKLLLNWPDNFMDFLLRMAQLDLQNETTSCYTKPKHSYIPERMKRIFNSEKWNWMWHEYINFVCDHYKSPKTTSS